MPEGPHHLHRVPQNSSIPTNYNSKVSLNTNLGRINSLKQFQANKINGSRDVPNPQYLSISNLKENPKGSPAHHLGFRKKKGGPGELGQSRSREQLNFYSNVISPIADPNEEPELYSYEKSDYYTQKMQQDLKKHQKSASLAESNLHNLYNLSQQSGSRP